MKRIGVVGRCHVSGIGDALMHMVEDCEVFSFIAQEGWRDLMQPHAEKVLAECDVVFAHYLYEDHGFFGTENLRRTLGTNIILIPAVVFSGFHPDCISLIVGRTSYLSPVGAYHSAIVAAAYSLDLPSDRVATLFNKFVYRRLGYFEEFARARSFLHTSMERFGLDIAEEWPHWVKSGTFMHGFNHPKPCVLASLAKLLAVKAGLVPAGTPTPVLGFDYLGLSSIWPVYPEIGQALGVTGSYVFKKAGTPEVLKGEHTLMSLEDFIHRSYEMYEDLPMDVFDIAIVARTRAVLSGLLLGKAC